MLPIQLLDFHGVRCGTAVLPGAPASHSDIKHIYQRTNAHCPSSARPVPCAYAGVRTHRSTCTGRSCHGRRLLICSEIGHCAIDNRENADDSHDVLNLDAFNTDGFDVAGRDIHIHDCVVWNQDDCFTIQPLDSTAYNSQCTENVLVENVEASGLGLTVGAVHPTRAHNCVRNVTFRNATMHHTFKGIYVKSGSSSDALASGEITNIRYEDILMDTPSQVSQSQRWPYALLLRPPTTHQHPGHPD